MIYKFSNIYWNAEVHLGYSSYTDCLEQDNATHVMPGNVARLLSVLCSAYPRYVTNRELKQRIWDHEFLSDESVTQLISRARGLLKDNNKSVLINTKGRGYRLQIQPIVEQDEKEIETIGVTEKYDVEASALASAHLLEILQQQALWQKKATMYFWVVSGLLVLNVLYQFYLSFL